MVNRVFMKTLIAMAAFAFCSASTITFTTSESNSTESFFFNSPAFDLGNKTFDGLSATKVILVSGCDGFTNLPADDLSDTFVLVHQGPGKDFCPAEHYIYECQHRNCRGVIKQDFKRMVAGMSTWSVFEAHVPRSRLYRPLVAVNSDDYDKVRDVIISPHVQNFEIVLTNDNNPWKDVFLSVAFLLIFRIFFCTWCVLCFFLSLRYLHRMLTYQEVRPRQSSQNLTRGTSRTNTFTSAHFSNSTSKLASPQSNPQGLSNNNMQPRNKLALVCLVLECIGNLERISVLAVDPFYSQQIVPYLPATLLLTISMPLKLATNILMLFFWREVTTATSQVSFVRRLRVPCYFLIGGIFVAELTQSVLDGLFFGTYLWSIWIIKSAVYVVINVVLGAWLFYEGFHLLQIIHAGNKKRASGKNKAAKSQKQQLARLVVISAFSMFLLGVFLLLVPLKSVFGRPWGYFVTWLLILLPIQSASTAQILVFGGVSLSIRSNAVGVVRVITRTSQMVLMKRGSAATNSQAQIAPPSMNSTPTKKKHSETTTATSGPNSMMLDEDALQPLRLASSNSTPSTSQGDTNNNDLATNSDSNTGNPTPRSTTTNNTVNEPTIATPTLSPTLSPNQILNRFRKPKSKPADLNHTSTLPESISGESVKGAVLIVM